MMISHWHRDMLPTTRDYQPRKPEEAGELQQMSRIIKKAGGGRICVGRVSTRKLIP